MNFNPIQMGSDFSSWYLSDLEIRVRNLVDQLMIKFDNHVPIDILEYELINQNLSYNNLPQSCKDIIDELEVY